MPRKKSLAEIQEENEQLQKLVYRHVETSNTEMGAMKQSMVAIQVDIAWLKQYFWIVVSANGLSLLGVLYLIIK